VGADAALSSTSLAGASLPPDVATVTRRLDDLYRSSASIGTVEMTSKTETQSRHLKLRMWTKGTDRALIVIDEPAREAGTATLRVGNNLWNWLPKIARTIRVPPSMMLASWMGTDFTNDDLVKESSTERDFETVIAGRSADPAGWLLRAAVRPGVVGRWQKIEWVVDDAGELPLLARHYDRRGRLARTMRFLDVVTMGPRRIPSRMVLESADQPGHRMELRFLEMQFDAEVGDDVFSLSSLERAR
jgi:hypothetical protein